jgi:hypothetical protein
VGNARHILLVVVWDLQCDLQSALCFPCVCVQLSSVCMVHVALLSVLEIRYTNYLQIFFQQARVP